MSDEPCPGCGETSGVTWAGGSRTADSWVCNRCGMRWAVTLVNPRPSTADFVARLADAVEELGALRWLLTQVVELADAAPTLTDEQLRAQLTALADRARLRQ